MLKKKIDVWRWEPGTHPVNRPKTSHRRYLRTQLQKRNFNCETWHVHYAPDWQSQRRQFEWQQRKNFQLTNAEVYLLTLSDFVSFSLLLLSWEVFKECSMPFWDDSKQQGNCMWTTKTPSKRTNEAKEMLTTFLLSSRIKKAPQETLTFSPS